MAWDDSDSDVEEWGKEAEALQKEEERRRRREEGLSSESEAEAKPVPVAPVRKKAAPKAKQKETVVEKEPELTKDEKRLRQRKLEEEQDARVAQDLFSGCKKVGDEGSKSKAKASATAVASKTDGSSNKPAVVVVDAFASLQLHKESQVLKLAEDCVNKVCEKEAQKLHSFFLIKLLKEVEANLTNKELDEIEKTIGELLREKKLQKTENTTKENKANKVNKSTKFNASCEWEEVYGGGEGDEDWTQEEWDAWNTAQRV